MESWFSTLKSELGERFESAGEAKEKLNRIKPKVSSSADRAICSRAVAGARERASKS
jgi:hypothetical protein